MPIFDHFSVPRIVFGRGTIARLAELARPFGERAALVYNGTDSPPQKIQESLRTAGIETIAIRQKGEPTVHHIDAALHTARASNCDLVIGLGGGSAIDAAKALAGLLTNPGTALDYLEVVGKGQKITKPAAPFIAIPTTAGTGAEATRNAVLGVPEKNFKASLRSELLLPRIALIDPELATAVPPDVTASSGMDALCQCIEAYTSTGATPMTDLLAIDGVELAGRALIVAFREPANLDAREDMALAALNSGIALTNAGLGAVHGFAAPLGASFPVPHGTVCAALLAPVMRANVKALRAAGNQRALDRYQRIGQFLSLHLDVNFAEDDSWTDHWIDHGIERIEDLTGHLQIPRLSTFGISQSDIPPIVALAQKASSMKFNPIQLPPETLAQILQGTL